MKELDLSHIRLGAATAALQIEGGDKNNNWYAWYKAGHIKDGSDPSVACMHCQKTEGDARLLTELNLDCYRMGIEWAKLEPQRGVFDNAALEYYQNELKLYKALGVSVMVTLHHFTEPLWFFSSGSFLSDSAQNDFLEYVGFVVNGLKGLVSEYITFNEPNVYAYNGYYTGEWPPGERSRTRTAAVMSRLAECHRAAYKLIHELDGQVKVGWAHHVAVFEPVKSTWFKRFTNNYINKFFNTAVEQAFNTGVLKAPLKGKSEAGRYSDFIGINYYSRHLTDGLKTAPPPADAPKNDLGWEIYPQGLAQIVKETGKYGMDVYITENGTADNHDSFRAEFIYRHLEAIAPFNYVKRYYHWTLYDNFEWLEGFSARFGLYETDTKTLERKLRKSGEFYAAVAKEKRVTQQMYNYYIKGQ